MDQFNLLGKRDIFGIVLPGTIVVFGGIYVFCGVIRLWTLQFPNLLKQQFLLSLLFLIVSYLVGNLLRLFAADKVDKKSSEKLEKAWKKTKGNNAISNQYEKCKTDLEKDKKITDIPDKFDDWLWRVDDFPYHAWQTRKWQMHGPPEVLHFFRKNHRNSMWSQSHVSPKTFFNYCKLVVIKGNGDLADEVNLAEGLTRFFAGTVIALQTTLSLLIGFLGVYILKILFSKGIGILDVEGIFHFILTILLIISLWWIRYQILNHFRLVRLKETETVYHAFYLVSAYAFSSEKKEKQ